jgi:hypothetical protein
MRTLRLSVLLLLSLFAAALRARPFAWEETPVATRVRTGEAAIRGHDVLKPEGAGDALMTLVHARGGAMGLSLLSLALFAAAAGMALDAAAALAGFPAAAILSVFLLPLGLGDSAPDPWLFSALFTAAFLQIMARARMRSWPPATLALLPFIAAVWPLFHAAGVLLAPALALLTALDGFLAWRAAENAVEGGVFTAPVDPVLFREEEIDMPSFLRVLSWETKTNQYLHQRIGMTPAQLPSLTAGRAVEVLNSLLGIADLPQEIGIPAPAGSNGDVRLRNRKLLEIQYKDALKTPAPKTEPIAPRAPLPPLPLWAPLGAAAAAFAAVAVPPAGPQALGRLFAALSGGGARLAMPSGWWIHASRNVHPAAPYFWVALLCFLTAGLAGLAKDRERFSAVFFVGGLALFTLILPAPAAAPLAAVTALPFAAFVLRGFQKDRETSVRTLSSTAGLIALLVLVMLLDWDHMPLGAPLGLGAAPVQGGK